MKIYWGIYCHAHWYDITAEMLRCVKHACHEIPIEIHATGPKPCMIELQRILSDFQIEAQTVWHTRNQFEYPAIHAVWENAKNDPSGKTCYIHSKGVTSPCPTYSKWRWMMENLILLEIEKRTADLDLYQAVGCSYKADWNCFAGNWWCARNDWLATLPEPPAKASRFDYERWLLQGCQNFKGLAKHCSGGWPNFPGEPCSSAYYNGIESIYRPALFVHLDRSKT